MSTYYEHCKAMEKEALARAETHRDDRALYAFYANAAYGFSRRLEKMSVEDAGREYYG